MAQIKGIHSLSGYNGGSFATTETYPNPLLLSSPVRLLPLFRLLKQYSLCDLTFHMRLASVWTCGNVHCTCESDHETRIPFPTKCLPSCKKQLRSTFCLLSRWENGRLFVFGSSCYRLSHDDHLMRDDWRPEFRAMEPQQNLVQIWSFRSGIAFALQFSIWTGFHLLNE